MDKYGVENGKGPDIGGLTKEECFENECRTNANIKGCTYHSTNNVCNKYTGSVDGGNGNAAHKCFRRRGKKCLL